MKIIIFELFFVQHRIIAAFRSVEFVSDNVLYIVLRGR